MEPRYRIVFFYGYRLHKQMVVQLLQEIPKYEPLLEEWEERGFHDSSVSNLERENAIWNWYTERIFYDHGEDELYSALQQLFPGAVALKMIDRGYGEVFSRDYTFFLVIKETFRLIEGAIAKVPVENRAEAWDQLLDRAVNEHKLFV